MDNKTIKKEREELEEFFKKLYKEDSNDLEKITLGLSEKEREFFLKGYKYANKYPSAKLVRLIVMYTLDYIPYYRKVPTTKNIVFNIWDIFKKNIYNDSVSS